MAGLAWLLRFQLVMGLWAVQTAQAAFFALASDAHPTSAHESRSNHCAHPWRLADPGIDSENGLDAYDSPSQPLEIVQVHHPPRVPQGGSSTTQLLLEHDFANSYYKPAIVPYNPPNGSATWAAIVLNLTVTSKGTQFDRLASLSLNNVEIWRTSTAEPTRSGVIWRYKKDVTRFASLFRQPGQLMFELNNIVNKKYTGVFSVSLSVTFYAPTDQFPEANSADVILPLTTGSAKGSQMLVYPGDTRRTLELPLNSVEAYLEIIATGAAEEEFWYTNSIDRWRDFFPKAGLLGKGPYREVQVRIDETLAGVVHPFPVIYTGGANPLLWRPLASLRAFDIPSMYLDLTPFLPILCDGGAHDVTFMVLGQGEDNSVNHNWFIAGAVHVVLDKADPPIRTTGRILNQRLPPTPLIIAAGFPSADHKALNVTVGTERSWSVRSEIETGSGGKKLVTASMRSEYSNAQELKDGGLYQQVTQNIAYQYKSTHVGVTRLSDQARFPLKIATNYSQLETQHRFSAVLPQYGYMRDLAWPAVLGGNTTTSARTEAHQKGFAEVTGRVGQRSFGHGWTEEDYYFTSLDGGTYHEQVKAVNGSIVSRIISGMP